MTPSLIRLLLVDDHPLFRESVARLLAQEPGMEVVGQCASLTELRQCLTNTSPDVILLDYDLGAERGTDFLALFERHDTRFRVLLVTSGIDSSTLLTLLQAGVDGVVLKHSEPRHLVEAIRRAASGGTWWDINPATALAAASTSLPPNRTTTLTARQQAILHLLLDGLTNKEIADKIQVSESSVKASIQELFTKAGVRTRSQLVRVAIEKHSRDWLDFKR